MKIAVYAIDKNEEKFMEARYKSAKKGAELNVDPRLARNLELYTSNYIKQ
jgi:hypothetical protein